MGMILEQASSLEWIYLSNNLLPLTSLSSSLDMEVLFVVFSLVIRVGLSLCMNMKGHSIIHCRMIIYNAPISCMALRNLSMASVSPSQACARNRN